MQAQDAPEPLTCTARTKGGKKCRNRPINGIDKCRMHCGMSGEKAKAKGQRNLAQISIAELVSTLESTDLPPADPTETMLFLIAREKREEALWSAYVAGCTAEDVLTGDHSYAVSVVGKIRTQLAQHCKMALDAGIEQRRLDLQKEQATVVAQLLLSVIEDRAVDLTLQQRSGLRKSAARIMRALPDAV